MKDEIGKYIEIISTYDELEKEIDNYMYYYNNERYQYNLAKLSPNEYLEYYKTGNYPLKHIIEEPIEYKKKFSLVKQNLDRNLTFKKLTSVIIKISHLKTNHWITYLYVLESNQYRLYSMIHSHVHSSW